MGARHVFNLRSADPRRRLPVKILLVQAETETYIHILLKILAFLMFHRDRLLMEPSLDDEHLLYRPDLAHLDYEGRITLWVECGECSVEKLDRLAVKAPYGEIWSVKKSPEEAAELIQRMARARLRTGRYGVLGLDTSMIEELTSLATPRNDITWHRCRFEEPQGVLQFEFNGLWFESEFSVGRF